jgi:hypothetical protein
MLAKFEANIYSPSYIAGKKVIGITRQGISGIIKEWKI